MEESKLQKSCQGYHNRRMEHRRVFRNKREDLTSKQMPFKENNPRVQQGGNKVHSVKPIKDEIKPGNVTSRSKPAVANKEQSKTSAKEKDIQVTGMHPKEYKNNEGRKYPSKEKSNRPLKISHPDRTQNKRKKVSIPSVNGEENVAKEQHKIESELMSMKQSDVAIPAVQYLKPAVHVQPLQQHPEGVNSGASGHQGELRHLHNQSNFDLLQNDTSLNLQHLLNERKQDCLVERDHEKESKEVRSIRSELNLRAHQSTIPKRTSVKASPKPFQNIPAKGKGATDKSKAAFDFRQSTQHSDDVSHCENSAPRSGRRENPEYQEDTGTSSTACPENDKTKPLDEHLPSRFRSTFVSSAQLKPSVSVNQPNDSQTIAPQSAEHRSTGDVITDSNIKDKPAIEGNEVAKNLLELSTPIVQSETQTQLVIASKNSCIVQGPHCKVQHFESQDPLSCDKYGYRISVDSLFSTSFFPSSQFNPKVNKDIEVETEDLYRNHKSDCGKIGEIREISGQAPALSPGGNKSGYSLQDIPESSQIKADVAVKPNINQTKSASFLAHDSSLESSVLKAHAPDYEHARNYDIRIMSPRSGAEKVNESSHFSEQHKFNLSSPRNELLHKSNCDVQSECIPELISDPPFASPDIKLQTYKHLSDKVEDSFSQRDVESDKLTLLTSVESSEIDAVTEKDTSFSTQQLNHGKVLNHPDRGKASESEMHSSTLPSINYDDVPNRCTQLQTEVYTSSREGDTTITLPVTINKTLLYTETQLHSSRSEKDKQLPEKNEATIRSDGDDTQVHRPTFSQVPYMPNPFLGHSLLTHRHAIPSAFVYPSRVGIPGSHSGFNEIGQHSGTSPSSHIFPPHGSTVCLNVGGRLFEILPSTFAAYPESLLYQIFTGVTSAPISQKGHIFIDRDGYLFEIILAFARTGHLTLPPRVSLPSLINEAEFFGMYQYMFQQDQIPSGSPFHFQRTTSCTLCFDIPSNKSDTKVFVLQREDKLKIESLKVSGACRLYVDLYTPAGVKETSNFLLYDADKPDLWKAYQFCAERQLVFHLGQTDAGNHVDNNPSAYIVFAQTFVFCGDEFIP